MKDVFIDEDSGILVRPYLYDDWKEKLKKSNILYIPSIIGIGATTSAKYFVENYFSTNYYFDCKNDDISSILDLIKEEFDKRKTRIIVIDELQTLDMKEDKIEIIKQIFSSPEINSQKIKFLIITNGFLPEAFEKILMEKNVAVIDHKTLYFNMEEIKLFFSRIKCNENEVKTCLQEACFYYTSGHPKQVCLWVFYVKLGEKNASQVNELVKYQYFKYVKEICINGTPIEVYKIMIKLSVWSSFTIEMAHLVIKEEEKKYLPIILPKMCMVLKKDKDIYNYIPETLEFLRSDTTTLDEDELKKLYCIAGNYYEKKRNFIDAIRCYEKAQEKEKFIDLVSLLAENGDGSIFAKEGYYYLEQIPKEQIDSNPSLLSAKAMLCSYNLRIDESEECIEKLKEYVEKNKNDRESLKKYLRLLVSVNHVSPDVVLDRIEECIRILGPHDTLINNIIPTGGMPSAINGRLDLCSWIENAKEITKRVDMIGEPVLGKEVIGWKEVFLGEIEYLQNKRFQAISTLTRGVSNASIRGVTKIQYAGVGILSQCFIADNQFSKAVEILQNMIKIAKSTNNTELIPSINASIGTCYLKVGNLEKAKIYFKNLPVFDGNFFLSERFYIYSNALFFIAQGNYSYALHLLYILKDYAQKYNRNYIKWKVNLLISAILFRNQSDDWKELFIDTVKEISKYNLIRIIADEGVFLAPLFRQVNFSNQDIDENFISSVLKELRQMEVLYPQYLNREYINVKFTNQEIKVINLMIEGYTNKDIEKKLNISLSTVKKEVSSILKKLGTRNRARAIKMIYRQGISNTIYQKND